MCFYISPHKAERHIGDMIQALGDRKAALVREISKVFQEAVRGNLSGILERVKSGVKGELVLVVDGKSCESDEAGEVTGNWRSEALMMRGSGQSVKDIVNAISAKYNIARNLIKRCVIE